MTVPLTVLSDDGPRFAGAVHPARWWRPAGDRILCELCPRACLLKDGDRGFCFVRQNFGGRMVLTTYGRSTGFCVDPIEKKPLNHFLPGTSVLSFGTAGCNLGCKFCQNWDISKSREIERLSDAASPEAIARAAQSLGCASVAFTYNDPVIWAEYAIDTAKACHAAGVRTVAVTAGYICPEARAEFFRHMDAANVDLKAFTEEFYYRLTLSHLEPVLDTLRWLKRETDVWFEITNLVIPRANDDPDELRRLCDWVLKNVGDDVPLHFTAFHPDYRLTDRERTPHETLIQAREIALRAGLKFVYVGNVNDVERQSTYCPSCKRLVIERNWHALGVYALDGDRCRYCGERIAGRFADGPGTWGRRRMRVDMRRYEQPASDQDPLAAAFAEASRILQRRRAGNERTTPQGARERPASAGNSTGAATPAGSTGRGRWPSGTAVSAGTAAPIATAATDGAASASWLSQNDGRAVLRAARAVIVEAVTGVTRTSPQALAQVPDRDVFGVFTSIKRRGRLR
ncbi:MAG: AmmeMemoRadiSam system radical SAM enzyme, partial [Planctomycetota bacterium]